MPLRFVINEVLDMTPTPSRRHPLRRALLAVLVAAATSGLLASPASAAPRSGEYLLAADPAAEAVHVYRTSDLKRTGSLEGVGIASHAGTLQLPDGRVIMIDDKNATVDAVRITANGKPRIVDQAKIPGNGWEGATWAAADASLHYLAFSGEGADTQAPVTIVNLTSFAISQVQVPTEADSSGSVPETQVYLAGRPLQLVVTTGGQFRAAPLSTVLAKHAFTPTSTAPVGAGTHGPVVSRRGDRVFSTTADGFSGANIPGNSLGSPRSVAYSSSRDVVQNYRPRLAVDGRTVWGSAAEDTGLTPEQWADTRNDVNVIDTSTFTSRLVRLPDGVASRLALSKRYAAVATTHPDGDVLTLLDSRSSSPTARRIVGTIALPAASGGPVEGKPTTGTQSHFVALDASGSRAYISNGGDGRIVVVSTKDRSIVRTIKTPTALDNGGYLTVVKKGTALADLVAR